MVAQGGLSAFESYRASMVIAERLADSDPTYTGWRRDLSVSQEKIGDVLVARGDLPGALVGYRASVNLREGLAASDPKNAGWLRDVAVSMAKLADFPESGVRWADVADKWVELYERGILQPVDRPFVEEAQRRANAERK